MEEPLLAGTGTSTLQLGSRLPQMRGHCRAFSRHLVSENYLGTCNRRAAWKFIFPMFWMIVLPFDMMHLQHANSHQLVANDVLAALALLIVCSFVPLRSMWADVLVSGIVSLWTVVLVSGSPQTSMPDIRRCCFVHFNLMITLNVKAFVVAAFWCFISILHLGMEVRTALFLTMLMLCFGLAVECLGLWQYKTTARLQLLLDNGFTCHCVVSRSFNKIVSFGEKMHKLCPDLNTHFTDFLRGPDVARFDELLSMAVCGNFQSFLATFHYTEGNRCREVDCRVLAYSYNLREDSIGICVQFIGEPRFNHTRFVDMSGDVLDELDVNSDAERSCSTLDSVIETALQELEQLWRLHHFQLSEIGNSALAAARQGFHDIMVYSPSDLDLRRHAALACLHALHSFKNGLVGRMYEHTDFETMCERKRDDMEIDLMRADMADALRDQRSDMRSAYLLALETNKQLGNDVLDLLCQHLGRPPLRSVGPRHHNMKMVAEHVIDIEAAIRV